MSVENIQLGVCNVTLGEMDLGLTKGGVEVELSTTTKPITVDQFGETLVSERIMGRSVKVKVPMAEATIEKMALILPGATLSVDKNTLTVSNGQGLDLIKLAQALVLTPDDGDDTLTFHKASTPGSFNFAYRHNEERIYTAEFTVYPDTDGKLFTRTKAATLPVGP